MDNDAIVIEHSPAEQHSHDRNQQDENVTQNQSSRPVIGSNIRMAKKIPMNPTPLEYSWWSQHRTARAVIASVLYVCLVIIIAVMIVCLAPGRPTPPICAPMLHPTIPYSDRDSSRPQSIAISDFNNDDHMDLVVANSGLDNVGVFLGDGDSIFGSQILYSTGTGSAPRMVIVGNFNNDSRPDIAIANFGTNNIRILFGHAHGNFSNQTTIDTTPSRPLHLAVANFNDDQHLDIAFVGYGTNILGVVLGFGNGTFRTPMTFFTGYDSFPKSVAVGDFNNDSKLDIAVANSGTDYVGILLGHGDGTFTNQITYTTGAKSRPYSIAISDLNNDAHLDIVTANSKANNLGILFGYGNGGFSSPTYQSIGASSDPIYIAVADLNNDQRSDIAVANNSTDSMVILFGNGDGTFANELTYSTGFRSSPSSIGVADFNHDNQVDIAIVNERSNNIKIFDGCTNETFASQISYETNNELYSSGVFVFSTGIGSYPQCIVHSDFNNDGALDFAVANALANNVGIFLGYGNGTFLPQVTYSTGDASGPWALALGDFNNDGQVDIAVANAYTNNIGIFLGYGNGTFSSQITYVISLVSQPVSLAVGDLNNDGILDVVVITAFGKSINILLGYNNGSFSAREIHHNDDISTLHMVVLGDLNNDGWLDIVVANFASDNIDVFLAHGNAKFLLVNIYRTSSPVSIALGDVDNDSRLDIVVANSGTDTIGVFLGYGDGTFSPQITYPTGDYSLPQSISLGDIDSDGALDVAVANFGTQNIGVFLGYGNGTFSPQIIYSTGTESYPVFIDSSDFNNDGRQDIAIANSYADNIGVLLGNWNDSFSPQTTFSTGSSSHPISIAVGDFNNDGRLDIAVANWGTKNISVFLGHGNGTFASGITYSTSPDSHPISMAVADFNDDGRLDIAVANLNANNVGVLLGNGDGTFSSQITFSTGPTSWPRSIVVGDFNNDDRLDIAVVNAGTNNVGVLLGYANGSFSSQITSATDTYSALVWATSGDLNNDGRLDVVITSLNRSNVAVLLGQGDGNFESPIIYSTGDGSKPTSVIAGDFNNDGRLDIAVSNSGTNNVCVFLGQGDGNLSLHNTYFLVGDSYPDSVIVGDFNNDGILDIAVPNTPTDNLSIFLGYGDGNFQSQRIYSTGLNSFSLSITTGDFNKDGQLDIAVSSYATNNIIVLLGQGNGIFPCVTCADSWPCSVAIGDLNGDNRLDIVVANSGTDNIGILFGNGNGSFERQITHSTDNDSYPMSIVVDDFNGDTRLDIAVANLNANNIGIFLGYGNGTFSPQIVYSTDDGSGPISIAVGDFNNDSLLDVAVANYYADNVGVFLSQDGEILALNMIHSTDYNSGPFKVAVSDLNHDDRLDIAVVNSKKNNIGILLGYGDGSFRSQMTFTTGTFSLPAALVVGDFNNDSILDIAAVNTQGYEAHVSILLGIGNGSFSSHGKYLTGTLPSAIVVGHFNYDNRLDIAVTNNGTDTLGIFFGYGDGTFSEQTIYTTGVDSSPVSIATGDFNNDNQIDVVVANYGVSTVGVFLAFRNTTFPERTTLSTGSAALSQTIALGDFTDDGQLDIVIGNDGTHNVEVLVSEGNGSFIIQSAYSADSSFFPESIIASDFNNDSRLDIAFINSATDSVDLLFGEGNGTFVNYTTYSTGVNSNPQSIAIGDFDNNNREDIVFADSGSRSVGLLLKIDNGALEQMRTFSTGSGSKPHGLTVGDFDNDGRLDVAVANNGNANIGFFFGLENGTFSGQKIVPVEADTYPTWIGTGDFNNDSQLDVVIVNNFPPSPVIMLLGNGNGTFRTLTLQDIGPANTATIGDLNGDDRLDLVLCQTSNNTIAVLIGEGDGFFRNGATCPTGDGAYPQSVAVGDFNNDKHFDIAVANTYNYNIGILLGNGDGTFSNQMIYYTGVDSYPVSIVTSDLNNDNQLDIVVVGFSTNCVTILIGYGDGTFSTLTTYPTGDISTLNWVDIADFNNDGHLDIALSHYGSGHLGIFLGHVNGTFFNEITYSTGDNSGSFSIGVGDLNNDGRLDIIVSNMLTENIGVFLGYTSENFVGATAYSTGGSSQPVSVAVGDFNKDTYVDVVVADQGTDKMIVLHGSGYGTFSNPNSYPTGHGSHPSWVAVADFNQDHQLDIVVVNSGTSNIGIFLGNGNSTFLNLTTYSTGDSSLPLSLAVGHFDNDTHLDIAVTNLGSSNVCLFLGYGNGSFASPSCFTSGYGSHPSALAFGDVNGDNLGDVVICNNGYSTIEILSMTCSP